MKTLFTGIIFYLIPLSCFSQTKESFSVYFDFDSYTLTRKAAQQLDSFFLSNKEEVYRFQYELYGHCDSRGSDPYNDSLSGKRVSTVKYYLLKKGLRPDKNIVAMKGYGKRAPLNENKTDEERQLNRRVEIFLILTTGLPAPQEDPGLVKEKTGTLKQKISDSTTIAGTNIILHDINFEGGTHLFLEESGPTLIELLDAMRTYPRLVIRVEGHICCHPDEGDGLDTQTGLENLSTARAKAVHDYLLKNDILANRVSYKGFGHSAPLYAYPEKTEDERKLNRRVEIKIIRK